MAAPFAVQHTYKNHAKHAETSEWEDIHRGLGNLPAAPEPPQRPARGREFDLPAYGTAEAARAEDAEFEGEEDEDAVRRYRTQRLAELRRETHGQFGTVRHLQASEYKREINLAGDRIWVVLALHADDPASRRLLRAFDILASRHASVKFAAMVACEAMPGYPAANCPTIVVYNSDELLGQFIGARAVGIQPREAHDCAGAESGPSDVSSATKETEEDAQSCEAALGRVIDFQAACESAGAGFTDTVENS